MANTMIPQTAYEVIRSLSALICFTVLPGLSISAILDPQRKLHALDSPSWWVGWSLVANVAIALIVNLFRGALGHYAMGIVLLSLIGLVLIIIKATKQLSTPSRPSLKSLVGPGLVCAIALLWFGLILRSGPRIDYYHDQWFHVAHIRQAAESNTIIPQNPYWPDTQLADAYGTWHGLLAAVMRLADVDVLLLWRVGNAYIAALSFLVIYLVSSAFFSEPALRLVAAIVFLGAGVDASLTAYTFVYPWGISYLLLWISLGLIFRFIRSGDWRLGVSAIVIGLAPIFIHPQEFVFLCFAVLALVVTAMLLGRDRPVSLREWRRLLLLLGLIVAVGLPLLLIQYPGRLSIQSEQPATVFGTNPEFEPYQRPLARLLAQAFPYSQKISSLKYTLFPFKFVSLVILYLLPRYLDKRIRWFVISLAVAPTLAVLGPGFSYATQKVLTEAYAWRLLSLIPTPFIWAPTIVSAVRVRILGDEPRDIVEEKFAGSLGWWYFALISALVGGLGLSVFRLARDSQIDPARATMTPLQSKSAFDRLDQLASKPATVLSDPTTSYVIPALTKHQVVLNESAHGSREDLVTRFSKTRELLSSPYQSNDEATAVLKRYGVDLIVINRSLLGQVSFTMMPFYSDYTLDFLHSNPQCFRSAFDDSQFAVFHVLPCTSDDLIGKGQAQTARASAEDVRELVGEELAPTLRLFGYSLSDYGPISAGQDLSVDLYWQPEKDLGEPFAVWLELVCKYPERDLPYGKALRRIREIATGQAYSVETFAWLPVPPEGLKAERLYQQQLTLRVPNHMTGGECDLNLYALSRDRALRDYKPLPNSLMERQYTLPGTELGTVYIKP